VTSTCSLPFTSLARHEPSVRRWKNTMWSARGRRLAAVCNPYCVSTHHGVALNSAFHIDRAVKPDGRENVGQRIHKKPRSFRGRFMPCADVLPASSRCGGVCGRGRCAARGPYS
jgi:hypothetical protein